MTSYFDNIKWIMSSQKEINTDINTCTNTETNLSLIQDNKEVESDSDYEYDKIGEKEIKNLNQLKTLSPTNKGDYEKIYTELVEKEQIVRNRLDSDTVEKIKANYTEYMDSDVQIIKDFALIMETFVHIKDKLIQFETNIKEFENDMDKNKLVQFENKSELDAKFTHIESKIENAIELMNKINSNSGEFMEKIIQLENSIKDHDTHREQILSRLEKFDKDHNEIKNNNLKILSVFTNYQKYFMFSYSNSNNINYTRYLKYFGMGIGICSSLIFGYKYLKKN